MRLSFRTHLVPLLLLVAVLGTTPIKPTCAKADEQQRPNILWISCEDIGCHLNCYGYDIAITPNLDKLAARGIRYDKAFTVTGVCATCRSSIITGMYPTSIGSQFMRCKARLPEHIEGFPSYLRNAGYYCTNNSKTDYNCNIPKTIWNESSNKAHWRKRPAGAPFFAVFNYTGTHESKIWPRGAAHKNRTSHVSDAQRQDLSKLKLPPYYPDTPEVRRDWANYLENITEMDYNTGQILKQLDEDGLADDTIVFFWSDHGAGLPRAKRWVHDSGTHVPLIVHVPEKFRTADQAVPGTVAEELISLMDLGPTVLNLAGLPVPEHMHGRPFLGKNRAAERNFIFNTRDRIDERYDVVRSVRGKRYRYVRNYSWDKPYYQFNWYPAQTATMKEIRRLHQGGKLDKAARIWMAKTKPQEELYDTENDPHELVNLVKSIKTEDVLILNTLRKSLMDKMIETRDLGFFPESELVRYENDDFYNSRHAVLAYPGSTDLLRQLIAAASGKPPRKGLKSGEPALRYWMLRMCQPSEPELREALNDKVPCVRIIAADILCKRGQLKQGLPVLEQALTQDNPWAALQAAIAVDELGSDGAPAREALQASLKKHGGYVERVAKHALAQLEE